MVCVRSKCTTGPWSGCAMSSEFSDSTCSTDEPSEWVNVLLSKRLCWTLTRFIIAFSIAVLGTWAALWLGTLGCGRWNYGYPYPQFVCSSDYWLSPREPLRGVFKFHIGLVYFLIVSTGLAGFGAMWLWWNASTAHILKASRFLVINWVEGLASLGFVISELSSMDHSFLWLYLRGLAQVAELVFLQLLIQHRFQSLWPALNQPWLATWTRRMFTLGGILLGAGCFLLFFAYVEASDGYYDDFALPDGSCAHMLVAVLILMCACFLTWVSLMFRTLHSIFRGLQAAQVRTQNQTTLHWSMALQRSRRAALMQGLGMAMMLITTVTFCGIAVFAAIAVIEFHPHVGTVARVNTAIIAQCSNLLLNMLGAFIFSGAHRLMWQSSESLLSPTSCTCKWHWKCAPKPKRITQDPHWKAKTKDLARRGLRLRDLLDFYRMLGKDVMPSYQPDLHTTNDVVRLAIIPMTSTSCTSYAQVVNGAEGVTPRKMVTHNWSNLFRDLLASVVADALDEHTFEPIAELLSDDAGVHVVEELLQAQGSIDETYWICAFAINQHSGICGANPRGDVDPATQLPHPICSCSLPKAFNDTPPLNDAGESIPCEMNKFDDMMAYLFSCDKSFAEVVAVDASLELFGRAWCIAELAEGQRMGMAQSLKLRNKAVLLERQRSLENLKVEEMTASRPEDVEAILSKIRADVGYANFNRNLQKLIFDKNIGLVTAWKNADALQQMEELSHVLKWARLSTAVTDGMQVWQRWHA